jgi:hypothetical protein
VFHMCQLTSNPSKFATFRHHMARNSTIHGLLSHSHVHRRIWDAYFHDADLFQMTPEAWMICDDHGDDNLVTVKMLKPRQKWNHRPNRVSISSHFITILAPLQKLPTALQRKKIRMSNRCMSFSTTSPTNWSARSLPLTLFYIHCFSATNRPLWFHIPTSESFKQPFESAGPLRSSCYRSG